jgi:hypothetical protein
VSTPIGSPSRSSGTASIVRLPPTVTSCRKARSGSAALSRRLDRAAADLNPFLTVLAVGLIVLNLTLYIGMAAAGGASAASMRRPAAAQTAVAYPTEANFGR